MKLLGIVSLFGLILLLIFCIQPTILLAQNSGKLEILPDSCELITGKLDLVGNRFKELGEDGSYLLILGGSSKTEKSLYNKIRILGAVKYLVNFQKINNEQIAYGTGPSSNGLNYLKFYVNGKLVAEINTIKKGKLCYGIGTVF